MTQTGFGPWVLAPSSLYKEAKDHPGALRAAGTGRVLDQQALILDGP